MNNKMLKILGIALSAIGLLASVLSDVVKEKQYSNEMDEKIEQKLKDRDSNEPSYLFK